MDFYPAFNHNTQFFSTCNPDLIEKALDTYLRNQMNAEPASNKNAYKTKFTIKSMDQGGQEMETKMCVRIMKVDEKKLCVEFQKISGNQIKFIEHY